MDDLKQQAISLAAASSTHQATLNISIRQNDELLHAQRDRAYLAACEWLAAPNPFVEYHKAINEHHPGTGSWFLDSDALNTWKIHPQSTCLVHGKPGCGKTVLSSVVIQHLKAYTAQSTDAAVIYFFFNFNDSMKTKVENMIRSLILQLCAQSPAGRDKLIQFCTQHNSTQEDLSYLVLSKMLQNLLLLHARVFFVLDALDECAETSLLAKFLKSTIEGNASRVRVLTTSRNEDCLRALHGNLIGCVTVDFENEHARNDLRMFIQDTVTSDEELGSWSDDVQEEIRDALVSGADGM
jgi:Cdc6-like AAA superfamily ATPase